MNNPSSAARAAILERLRASKPPVAPVADFAVLTEKQYSLAEKQDRFAQSLSSVNAEVYFIPATDVAHKIQDVLQDRNITTLLAGEDPQADPVLAALQGIQAARFDTIIEEVQDHLFQQTPAALTFAHAGIAETGSLVAIPSAAEPRSLSLVPPLHIVVVAESRLFNTFHELVQQEKWAAKAQVEGGMPTNIVLISGPSKTADIEQTLAYGVHGPRELVVLVTQD
jgi:L-lactate dehydrogenase complex protein LldG